MAGHALHFHCARGLATQVLASVSDSLVRVSRRVSCARYVRRDRVCAETRLTEAPRVIVRHTQSRRTRVDKVHRFETAESTTQTGRKWVSSLRFQALFNSLFKVLCIFPSRYLFAIGLPPVFSFRWNLPPASGCTPKQPDSTRAHRTVPLRRLTGFSPSPIPRSKGFWRRGGPMAPLQTTIQEAAVIGLRISGVSSARFIRHY